MNLKRTKQRRAKSFARRTTDANILTRVMLKLSLQRGFRETLMFLYCGVLFWTLHRFYGTQLDLIVPRTPAMADFIEPRRGKTCIAIGMIARSTESELRHWHREMFQKYGNSHSFSDMVDIHLVFGMAKNPQLEEIEKSKLASEMEEHTDMMIFDFEETESCGRKNRCLSRNENALYRKMKHLCDGIYDSAYFVKTDSDVVHNFELMARVFMDLPNKSVYFGRLIPNMPSTQENRELDESSVDFVPVFAQGSFQGFSKDLLFEVLRRENIATVMKDEAKYYYPESDRALGAELRRANIPVKYPIFLKGCTYLCPAETFNCKNYWNSISFHAGYGFSGKGKNKMATKLAFMKSIHETQLQCLRPTTYDKDDHYVIFDDDILRNGNASYWWGRGCSTLNQEALDALDYVDTLAKELKESEPPKNWTCADKFYLMQNEKAKNFEARDIRDDIYPWNENEHELSKALARKMLQNDSDEAVFESRKHYITEGYRSHRQHYYCPHQCHADGDQSECNCDMEAVYLKKYPDVAAAVAQGDFKNGYEHFVKHGSKQGYEWSCYPTYNIIGKDGVDAREGCKGVFRDFAETAKHKMLDWPIGGSEDFQITYPACNAAVMVNDRDDPMVEFVLKNHRRYLGPYWVFYLIGPKDTADLWREKYSGPMVEIVDIPEQLGVNLSDYPTGYNTLLMSDFLWKEAVACENILITQTDALLLRNGIEDFFDYDYVGSPIYPESQPHINWRLLQAFRDESGGNGGLSFRKRSAMIHALEECELPKNGMEDIWVSACMVLLDRSLPDTRMANRFSIGSKCEIDVPFGTHKLWQNCGTSTCENTILRSRFHVDLYGDKNFDRNCTEGNSYYLYKRPDVAAAVAKGDFASGWDHYQIYGQKDGWEQFNLWRCLN